MSFELLRSLCDNDINNYKNSGLPKFIKYKPTIKYKPISNKKIHCIESIDELYSTLENVYGNISIDNIIGLYIDHDIIVSETVVVTLPIPEISKYREYDRSRSIYCSKRTPMQFDELYEDIKTNGIQQSGRIRIERISNDDVEIILGEGNHRLSIATQLGFDHMPIVFRFLL